MKLLCSRDVPILKSHAVIFVAIHQSKQTQRSLKIPRSPRYHKPADRDPSLRWFVSDRSATATKSVVALLQVKSLDETLQAVNRQSACLQSDLQDLQQERDSLKHDVSVLKKQLQNVNEKVRRRSISPQQQRRKALARTPRTTSDSCLFVAEPRFGEGLAFERPPEPEQEAVPRRDVPADGAGSAAAEAGEREAADAGAEHPPGPPAVQRKGEQRFKETAVIVVSIGVVVLLLLSRAVMSELVVASVQVRQLDATISSLKQHKQQSHSSLLKALEQENAALKQELEAQRELTKVCI